MLPGQTIHGEVGLSSGDLSTGTPFTLYDETGSVITPAAGDQIFISDLTFTTAGANTITVFFDHDNDNLVDAGEVICRLDPAANGGLSHSFRVAPCVRLSGTGPSGLPHVLSSSTDDVVGTFWGTMVKKRTW